MSFEELSKRWAVSSKSNRRIQMGDTLDTQIAAIYGLQLPEIVSTPKDARLLRESVRRKMIALQGKIPGIRDRNNVIEQAIQADTPEEAVRQMILFLIQSGLLVKNQR